MRLAIALIVVCGLSAAEVEGFWTGQMAGRNGQVLDISFRFSQSGDVLTGKLYGDFNSTEISEGRVVGGEVFFVVVTPVQQGNQINRTRLKFHGCLENGLLNLTREQESTAPPGAEAKPPPPVFFTLKRFL